MGVLAGYSRHAVNLVLRCTYRNNEAPVDPVALDLFDWEILEKTEGLRELLEVLDSQGLVLFRLLAIDLGVREVGLAVRLKR